MAPKQRTMDGIVREMVAEKFLKSAGFDKRVIKETIKEWVELHGDNDWVMIEEDGYNMLRTKCIEKEKKLEEEGLTEEEQEEEKAVTVDKGVPNVINEYDDDVEMRAPVPLCDGLVYLIREIHARGGVLKEI